MTLQLKYRRTHQLTDELNCFSLNTPSLFLSISFTLPLSLWTPRHTPSLLLLIPVFSLVYEFILFSRLYIYAFDILFFPCFWVCYLESVSQLCWLLFVTLFFSLFCLRWEVFFFFFFKVSFFNLACTMWLSLFLWCIIISCADKWTLHSRWQCRRSKEY